MINRRAEGSCSFRQTRLGARRAVLAYSVAAALAVVAGVPAASWAAAELLNDGSLGDKTTLLDPAASKIYPFDKLAEDKSDLALFPKVRSLRLAPSLDQEARCSWWLPRDLPLGGGFSYALFCGDTAIDGPGRAFRPPLGES